MYDKGISSEYNNSGWTVASAITRTRNSDSTNLIIGNTNALAGVSFLNNDCIEFDIKVSSPSDVAFTVRKGASNYDQSSISDIGFEADTWYHGKVTAENGRLRYWRDGVVVYTRTISTDHVMFYFRLQNGASLDYKEFKRYPI